MKYIYLLNFYGGSIIQEDLWSIQEFAYSTKKEANAAKKYWDDLIAIEKRKIDRRAEEIREINSSLVSKWDDALYEKTRKIEESASKYIEKKFPFLQGNVGVFDFEVDISILKVSFDRKFTTKKKK